MKLFNKWLSVVPALLVANTLSAETPVGADLILGIFDTNGNGTVERSESITIIPIVLSIRALEVEDFPTAPSVEIPSQYQQFDLDENGFIDGTERREAEVSIRRTSRRAEIAEIAELFDITRAQVREVRRSIRREGRDATLAAELVPVRDEILTRRANRGAQEEADRVARFQEADANGNNALDLEEFFTLPESRSIFAANQSRADRVLQLYLSTFVRSDRNSTQELELDEFDVHTGSFIGE